MTRAASDDAAVRVLAAIIVESSRMPKDDVVNLTTREMFMKEYSGQEGSLDVALQSRHR
jgi:hypothetical protein